MLSIEIYRYITGKWQRSVVSPILCYLNALRFIWPNGRILYLSVLTTRPNKMSSGGNSGSSLHKAYRITTTALSLIICIGLTIYIFYDSFKTATLYSWHPSFFTLGVSKHTIYFYVKGLITLLCDAIYFTCLIVLRSKFLIERKKKSMAYAWGINSLEFCL
jgi:hypothetical protein